MARLTLGSLLVAGCGSAARPFGDGGIAGQTGDAAIDTRPTNQGGNDGSAGRGGSAPAGSGGGRGDAGASGAAGGTTGAGAGGQSAPGAAGASGGGGSAGRGGSAASGGATGTGGVAGAGGVTAAGGRGPGGAASGGAGGRGTGSGGAGAGGRGLGGAGTSGAGGAAAAGGAGPPGSGGTSGCSGPATGAICGCGARLDCNGVCQAAGTCNALEFNGTTGSVSAAGTTALAMNQSATIEAWVRVHSHIEHGPIFRKVRSNQEDKALAIEGGYVRFYFYRGSASYIEIVSQTRVPLESWTHIAGVYDGTNISVYMNGVRTDTATVTGTKAISNADGDIYIGRVADVYDVTFDGVISDLRVSSIARYTTETFKPPALLPVDATTLALWRLDEGTGITLADLGSAAAVATIQRASASGPPRWVSVPARR